VSYTPLIEPQIARIAPGFRGLSIIAESDGIADGSVPDQRLENAVAAVRSRFAVPVGGENLAAYVGTPRLAVATGTEVFDTIRDGQPAEEHPEAGEVVWRDDHGVTCRRWNWRQGVRTRLDSDARRMWFILESLPAMPLAALHQAGDELAAGLQALMRNSRVEITLIQLPEGETV
jgi:DNA/RNA-binding domain of Phe-tRNA-synthetase-like protein